MKFAENRIRNKRRMIIRGSKKRREIKRREEICREKHSGRMRETQTKKNVKSTFLILFSDGTINYMMHCNRIFCFNSQFKYNK